MSQRTSARAQKARKQKITAGVLGGILLIVLVIQGPRTLKTLHGSGSSQSAPATNSSTSASSAVTPTSAATPTAASQLPAAPTASAASMTSLEDSDTPPTRKRSQLPSFDTFDSKDPFVQQVSQDETPTALASSTPSGSSAASVSAMQSGTARLSAESRKKTIAQVRKNNAMAATGSSNTRTLAVVDVNGKQESVGVAQAFPKANPTFRLVSLSNGVAKIGIAGGNYSSGAQTVALRLGHTLTLVNTSDGTRYELRLVSAR